MPDPEQLARQEIDALLKPCGWDVQDKRTVNLAAARGVAVRELTFKSGEPDYTLFVDGKVIGTIEAKPAGHSLTGVEEQSHVLESLGKQEGMLAGADYITSSVIPRRVELRCTVGNLENSVEEGKMSKKLRRRIVVRTKDTVGYENAAFSLEFRVREDCGKSGLAKRDLE